MVKTGNVSFGWLCAWYIMTYCNFRYGQAEECAQRALVLDPRFMKARYRRGLARKGNLELARAAVGASLSRSPYLLERVGTEVPTREADSSISNADFQTILKQDPDSTEAEHALRETYALMRERDSDGEDDDDDYVDWMMSTLG